MATKMKLSKKDLKQPDEFITLTNRAILFAHQYSKPILWGLGILIALVLITVGITYYIRTLTQQAFTLLAEADKLTESAEKKEEAKALYEKIIREYSLSRGSLYAYLALGHLYFAEGEYDRAIQSYKVPVDDAGKSTDLHEVALMSLAYAYQRKGECEKTIDTTQEMLANPQGKLHYEALLTQGRCYETLENYAKALESYEKVQQDFPQLALRIELEKKISQIRERQSASTP
jgi:tetratricopeptide (TPR) repeat protein